MLYRMDRTIVIYKMSSFCRMTPLNLQNEDSLQNATKIDNSTEMVPCRCVAVITQFFSD